MKLHEPISSNRSGPLSANAIITDLPLGGRGYLPLGWECPSRLPKCIEAIGYETVRDACRGAIEKQRAPQGAGARAVPVNDEVLD
jgi:hypothetical protein